MWRIWRMESYIDWRWWRWMRSSRQLRCIMLDETADIMKLFHCRRQNREVAVWRRAFWCCTVFSWGDTDTFECNCNSYRVVRRGQLRGIVLGTCQGVLGTDFSVTEKQFWRMHVDFACSCWLEVQLIVLVEEFHPETLCMGVEEKVVSVLWENKAGAVSFCCCEYQMVFGEIHMGVRLCTIIVCSWLLGKWSMEFERL